MDSDEDVVAAAFSGWMLVSIRKASEAIDVFHSSSAHRDRIVPLYRTDMSLTGHCERSRNPPRLHWTATEFTCESAAVYLRRA